MGIRLKESLRGLALATLMVAGAAIGVACGGDDSTSGSTSSTGGIDSGTSGNLPDTSTTSSSGDTGPSSSSGDTGAPDTGPPPVQAAAPTFTPPGGPYANAQSVVIASATPNATIHYTTDGTNPTTASVVYANPIAVAQTTTIRAMATATGFTTSTVSAATYTITIAPGTTAPVAFAPASGEYNNPVAVGLSTTTAPSTICYTIDGSPPTCAAGACTGTAATYSAGSPIPVDAPTGGGSLIVNAMACSAGNNNSDVTTSTYTFRAATPTAAPGSGEVLLNTNVTLATATATSGAKAASLRYNNSGLAPSCVLSDQTIANSAGNVQITKNTTYDVIACRLDYQPSAVAAFAYTVKLTTPTLTPAGGVKNNDTLVAAVEGAAPSRNSPAPAPAVLPGTGTPANGVNCYTLTGVDPVCGADGLTCTTGTPGSPGGVTVISTTAQQVRARACRPNFTPSEVVTDNYPLTVAAVRVNAPGNIVTPYNDTLTGNFWNGPAPGTADFNLQTDTLAETIRYAYSTGPTLPAPADVNCTQACTGTGLVGDVCTSCLPGAAGCQTGAIPAFSTIKAIACKANYTPSPQRLVVYADPSNLITLNAPLPDPSVIYNNDQAVTLTTSVPGTVCYTTGINNTVTPTCNPVSAACTTVGPPTCNAALLAAGTLCQGTYDGTTIQTKPRVQVDGAEIRAIACRSGAPNPSNTVSAIYQLQVAQPLFTPNGGNVAFGSTITWESVTTQPGVTPPTPPVLPAASFHYETGNPVAADPTCSSLTIGKSLVFDATNGTNGAPLAPGPTQIKVIACRAGYAPSAIGAATFSANLQPPIITSAPINPGPNPPYATFNNDSSVTLTSSSTGAAGGKICYTTDGGIPACSASNPVVCAGTGVVTQYAGAFTVATDGTTLRAITCANGFSGSTISSALFNFTVAAPTITPAAGSYGSAQNIVVTNGATNPALVCYSTNDTPIPANCAATGCVGGVTCESLANGAIVSGNPFGNPRGTNLTLRVRSTRTGYASSAEQRNVYLFTSYSRTIVIDGNNDWSDADNLIPTAVQNGIIQKTYVAWDANNVYLASQGPFLCTSCTTQYLDFYLRSTANGGTLTQDILPVNPGAQTQTTNVNVHFFFKTDGSSEGVRVWNGAAWGVPITPITYSVSFGGFATVNGITEYSISRASLGLTAANSILIMQSRFTVAGGDGQFAPWSGPAAPPYVNIPLNWDNIAANMTAANVPNAAVNIAGTPTP